MSNATRPALIERLSAPIAAIPGVTVQTSQHSHLGVERPWTAVRVYVRFAVGGATSRVASTTLARSIRDRIIAACRINGLRTKLSTDSFYLYEGSWQSAPIDGTCATFYATEAACEICCGESHGIYGCPSDPRDQSEMAVSL